MTRPHSFKMSFNPDVSKQAQEVVFSCNSHKLAHPPVIFNNVPVKRCSIQKHLGIHLDEKLNFNHHFKEKITKASKGIRVIKYPPKRCIAYHLQIICKATFRLSMTNHKMSPSAIN